jgi:hypothetical protein
MATCPWCQTASDAIMATVHRGRGAMGSAEHWRAAMQREPVAVHCSTAHCPTYACEHHAAIYFHEPDDGEPLVCHRCYVAARRARLNH